MNDFEERINIFAVDQEQLLPDRERWMLKSTEVHSENVRVPVEQKIDLWRMFLGRSG